MNPGTRCGRRPVTITCWSSSAIHGGSYLAAIPFAVTGPAGDEIVAGVSDGPLLYLRLPAATYRLAVHIDGVWQSRRIQPGPGRQPLRLTFVGRGD
jgi:hypothetical protein